MSEVYRLSYKWSKALLINCLEVGGEWLLYILRPGVEGGEGLAVVVRVVVQLCSHEGLLVL